MIVRDFWLSSLWRENVRYKVPKSANCEFWNRDLVRGPLLKLCLQNHAASLTSSDFSVPFYVSVLRNATQRASVMADGGNYRFKSPLLCKLRMANFRALPTFPSSVRPIQFHISASLSLLCGRELVPCLLAFMPNSLLDSSKLLTLPVTSIPRP